MKRAVLLVLLACVPPPRADASEMAPNPPLPSPAIPPAVVGVPPIPSAPALPEGEVPRGPTSGKKAAKPAPPKVVLGEKHEEDHSDWSGAGTLTKGKFTAKASGGTLTAVLSGVADSHVLYFIPSRTLEWYQRVQEFEIVPGAASDPRVTLALSGKLDGYLRSESHGTAALRQASAVVYPVCGGPSIGLDFPPCCLAATAARRCAGEFAAPPQIMPAGHYVLVINLVLETTADGAFRGHSVAVFAPDFEAGTWRSRAAEVEDLDEEGFGFSVTLKATAP